METDRFTPVDDDPQPITMADFLRGAHVTMTAERCAKNHNMPDSRDMDHWKVIIKHGRSRMTTYFSMGYGHNGKPPKTADVLSCLADDASGIQQESFEEWCRNLDYSSDSIKAKHIYKACEKSAARLRKLLGDSAFETLLYRVERA